MSSMMHTCAGFVGLVWAHKEEKHIFLNFFSIPKGHGLPKESLRWRGAERCEEVGGG